MTLRTSVVEGIKQIVGSANVLTDVEDFYVYSFEHIFREQRYPKVDAVVKVRSAEQAKQVMNLAEKEGFTVIRRGEIDAQKTLEPTRTGVVIVDDVPPPDLTAFEEVEKLLIAEDIREIHRAGHGTFRNFALALKTLFLSKPTSRCQECATCSGYCTVSPSFNGVETWSSKGRILLMKGLSMDELALSKRLIEVLYTCSTCGLCFAQCFPDLHVHEAIITARRHVAEKGLTPNIFNTTAKNIFKTGDPSGMPIKRRLSWMGEIPRLRFPERAEVLYWVGCMVATRTPSVAKAVANIMGQAKANFTMLGQREGCCGYVLLAAGLWNEAKELAIGLVERVEETDAEVLVTPCAGCYYTFTTLYPKVLDVQMPCEVLHTSQFVERLVKDGALELKGLNVKVTYHDPCSLGRHSNVYDSPRNVLKAVPNLQLVEMPLSRGRARCCGGGGGLWTFNHRVSMNSASTRLLNDVAPMNVDVLATACPACHMNFRYTSAKKSVHIKTYDIMEIVELSLLKSKH